MPKCRVLEPAFTWGNDRGPGIPWHDMVVYEMHVRGFSMRHPEVPEPLRGSYAALASAPAISYLRKLGITTVELMPVHAFVNDRYLQEKNLRNYWGYNTQSFFAPEMRYASSNKVKEFKTMVKTLHSAGIEVILDVVYNHSCEGSQLGPTLSFRGIDNAAYYILADDPRYYADFTGCGNTVNMSHPRALQMVMDSLRYWVEEMHVDGFRFDLASALARERGKVDHLGGFFDVIRQDPTLNRVKLIAEPWDLGMGGYQVGNFPLGWAEWNDRYRDGMRAYWKGDGGLIGDVAKRLTGSSDLYGRSGKRPHASINFITAHDGFTLHDLVSYNDKHNEANGEDNRDGNDQQPVVELRRRRVDRRRLEINALQRAPEAELPGHPDAVAGRAHAGLGRRAVTDPVRQQQRLLPGQRDQLARLVDDRRQDPDLCSASSAEPDRLAPQPPDLPAPRLLRRASAARPRSSRTCSGSSPTVKRCRTTNGKRSTHAASACTCPARPSPTPAATARQDRRRRLPHRVQRRPRGCRVPHAVDSGRCPGRALLDTRETTGVAAPRHLDAGAAYPLIGRSLVVLTRPAATS